MHAGRDNTGRRASERGQTLVLMVVFMMVLIAFIGVVVDSGMYQFERREMQGTADAAALAAIKSLPGSPSGASSAATSYAKTKNPDAKVKDVAVAFSDSNRVVTVTTSKDGTSNFSAFVGVNSPTIRASATAKVQMMGPRSGMLPLAFMRDTFTTGDNAEIKFDGSNSSAHGPIDPDIKPNCNGATGASDFRKLIAGAAHGGTDACATPILDTLDVEPGQMAGPTKQGFDDRLGNNVDSFTDVFKKDAATGLYSVEKPDSPRVGIVPIIENLNGTTNWPNGKKEIRVLAYMLVYIGKVDSPPDYPAYTNGGKSVWVTPVQTILPQDFSDGDFVDYNANFQSPVVYRLID